VSHSAEYEWRQRQEDRRRQHLARVRDTTAQFVARYEGVLDDVRRQGLDAAAPAEFSVLVREVAALRALLASDPERARERSLALGRDIHALPRVAREAQRLADARAVQRRREVGAELNALLDRSFREITDPVVRDFACQAAAGMEDEIKSRVARDGQLDAYSSQLQARMAQIVAMAETRAAEWKSSQRQSQLAAVQAEVLRDAQAVALEQHDAALTRAVDASEASFDAALESALDAADRAVVDEESRRAAVRAVYESLLQAGFAVDAPYLEEGERGGVVISARKPSGGQAQFRVGVEGGLVYKFDHYEGAACKQDLDQVLPMLQQVYGISLSNERVLWDNPDRLSRDARPLDGQEAQR